MCFLMTVDKTRTRTHQEERAMSRAPTPPDSNRRCYPDKRLRPVKRIVATLDGPMYPDTRFSVAWDRAAWAWFISRGKKALAGWSR